jgi:beta-lactamase regulating signal transducer with metallopeptidase domain
LIVAVWLTGVTLLSSRLLVSWLRAKRLVRRASRPRAAVAARRSTSRALRIAPRRDPPRVRGRRSPSVIGSLRPIILLPASALTGMTPEQIEMVLARDGAHPPP